MRFIDKTIEEKIKDIYKNKNVEEAYKEKDSRIKIAIIESGNGGRQFFKDPDVNVRLALVKKNILLDLLADDKDPNIRGEVALKGFYPNKMVNDPSEHVRNCAILRSLRFDKRLSSYDGRVDLIREGKHLDIIVSGINIMPGLEAILNENNITIGNK